MSKFNKRHYEALAEAIQWAKKDVLYKEPDSSHQDMLDGIDLVKDHLADMFKSDNGQFDRSRFIHACQPGSNVRARTAHLKPYQPKTGATCSCRRGVERDNCPRCEGTGMAIDFAAIRARVAS